MDRTPFNSTRCQLGGGGGERERDPRYRAARGRPGTRGGGGRERHAQRGVGVRLCRLTTAAVLLVVYFGGVDMLFVEQWDGGGGLALVVVQHHLPHQHHQLVQVLPGLHHKVAGVTRDRDEHIHVLTRLEGETDIEAEILCIMYLAFLFCLQVKVHKIMFQKGF